MVMRGNAVGTGATADASRFQVGKLTGIEHGIEMTGECILAGVGRRKMKQADVNAARLARLELVVEHLPGAAECSSREEIIAEYRMAEGLRLLDEGADQMTPVDLPDSLVAGAPMACAEQ